MEYRCKDDPEANDRKPKIGEQRYSLLFPLENGEELKVHMGKEGINHFATFIANLMVDEDADICWQQVWGLRIPRLLGTLTI